MLESAFAAVLLVALAGLALSVAIEGLMRPRPPLARPPATWALHAGLWLVTYGAEILLLARPLFVAASVSAFLLMLVLVHNAKMQA
ncbi:MAG: LTA synthase family protein, partial [Rhodocyclaceae bacterium]|nr:LTA synthase family protein [Rhodocyclaceae bacterium]